MDLFDKCRVILERIDKAQQRVLRKKYGRRDRENSKKLCREYGITPPEGQIVLRSGIY